MASLYRWLRLARLDSTQLGTADPLPYTWGGKGWGGPGPNGEGLDCSGFACGLLWRLGHLSPHRWTNTDGMLAWQPTADPRPLDVCLYGPSATDASHVAVVVAPGAWLVESGGAGSDAYPGGPDWPTAGRTWRWVRWDARPDVIGFRRVLGAGMMGARDVPMLREWVGHVRSAARGVQVPLSDNARAWGLRPVRPLRGGPDDG